MIGALLSYALVALIAFALGAIAENRARRAEAKTLPRDYDLAVHIGGQQAMVMRASHLVGLGGRIAGDVELLKCEPTSYVQLCVEAKAVPQ